MKLLMLIPLLTLAIIAAAAATRADQTTTGPAKDARTLYHVVNLKFKADTSKEQIEAVEDAFSGLKGKIEGIRSLDWGTNVSPEGLDKGFTHCFVLTYTSEQARDVYLKHPEHQRFIELLKPILADALVIDFWSKGK
ncbi:MAG TPA: Dabb family protein [Tepidisphaeraceae bacterium]|nr:Dabb family protein [Tepidisphaeraceae bacterium]